MDCRVSCPWPSEKITIDLQWEKYCEHSCAFIFNLIFFVLSGTEDMHECLDQFEFRQDPITDYEVNCPWASEKLMYNVVNLLAPSFLIESSFLQVTRTEF